jgi:hypothetical protein
MNFAPLPLLISKKICYNIDTIKLGGIVICYIQNKTISKYKT